MSIQNYEDAFAAICSILSIEHIYEIIIITDDQIRSICPAELAEILIKIKEETIKKALTELASVMHDTG
jgi:hypothetical protein